MPDQTRETTVAGKINDHAVETNRIEAQPQHLATEASIERLIADIRADLIWMTIAISVINSAVFIAGVAYLYLTRPA